MRVKILKTSVIELYPDNDADSALLNDWAEQQASVASSKYSDGKTLSLTLQFSPTPWTGKIEAD